MVLTSGWGAKSDGKEDNSWTNQRQLEPRALEGGVQRLGWGHLSL